MTDLAIVELLGTLPIDPEAYLDPDRVAPYLAQPVDAIDPVVVFRPDGLLLADGYQRLAAARRQGASTIRPRIRDGSRADALHYAANVGGARHGITIEHATDHIERLARSSKDDQC